MSLKRFLLSFFQRDTFHNAAKSFHGGRSTLWLLGCLQRLECPSCPFCHISVMWPKKIINCSFPLQSAVAINTRRYIKDRKDCIGSEGYTSPYCQSVITTKGIGGTFRGSIQRMTIRLQLVSVHCYHQCLCLYCVCTLSVQCYQQCMCLHNVYTMSEQCLCLYNGATNACVCTMLVCVWPQISGFTDHQMWTSATELD